MVVLGWCAGQEAGSARPSPYADFLSGDGGTYDYVYGYAGDDEIYDTGGYGRLHGGDDCDFLSADTTAGGDYCYCEDNGGDRSGCDWNDMLCDGCFD